MALQTALRRLILPLILLIIAEGSHASSSTHYGLRYVKEFSKEAIEHTQVWDISTGADKGHVYFATNAGLFDYNGVSWSRSNPKGGQIIRALKYDSSSSRLYSCGVNEFGYWTRNPYGLLEYHCIYRNRDFRSSSHEFWRIAAAGGKIFFQCKEKIHSYDPLSEEIGEIQPEQYFQYMYEVDGRMYYQDGNILYLYDQHGGKRVCETESRIINVTTGSHGELLAAIEHAGIMVISEDGKVEALDRLTNSLLAEAKITCCRRYSPDMLLVGTTNGGLFIIDNEGRICRDIPIGNRIDDSTILSTSPDERGNIWLGLDAGVVSIDNSTKDYYFSDRRLGRVHDFLEFKERGLLIGSNKGLFVLNGEKLDFVPRSTGPVWKIAEIQDKTYILHDRGIFILTADLKLKPIMTGEGTYTICRCRNNPDYYITGTYSGISLMQIQDGQLKYISEISGYNGYARDICIDEKDCIWVTVPNTGYVRLTLSQDRREVTEIRDFDLDGNGKSIFHTVIDTELLLCCGNDAYRIDYVTDTLMHSEGAGRLLELCGTKIKNITQRGNTFWYTSNSGIGCIERTGTIYSKKSDILSHAASGNISTGFRNINGAEAIGFRNGLGFSYGSNNITHPIEIGRVAAQGLNGTIYHNLEEAVFKIPYRMNTLCIWPMFLKENGILEYRIKSLSNQWQCIQVNDFLQIPSLPHGRHMIELRTIGTEDIKQLEVHVSHPWYISWYMIVIYILLICIIIEAVRHHYIKKAKALQQEQERRERERIAEMEMENLKFDIRSKDKSLANITMNNIKRNNILNEIKEKVLELQKEKDSSQFQHSVSQILRQIDTYLKADNDWQKSEKYFNAIYDGLLDRLKTEYPSLSKTDLRLCVYIKLNLSTKEMANLMNISPRSVEMARYRLRKKLGLTPEDSIESILKK